MKGGSLTLSQTVQAHNFELLVLLAFVYHSFVYEMIIDWKKDDNYSHSFLVPFIAIYLAYMRKSDLLAAVVRPCNAGLAIIVMGLCPAHQDQGPSNPYSFYPAHRHFHQLFASHSHGRFGPIFRFSGGGGLCFNSVII
jgi:hypothetical protein